MKNTSAYDINKIEECEKVRFVYVHSYNDISVIYDIDHITPHLLDIVEENCSETPFVYSIHGGNNERMRVSFEF